MDIPNLHVRALNSVKMSPLPNLIYRFSAISIKISVDYFVHIEKQILKFM